MKKTEITFQTASIEQAEQLLMPMLYAFGISDDDIEVSWGINSNVGNSGLHSTNILTPLIKVKVDKCNGAEQIKVCLGVFGHQVIVDLDSEMKQSNIREKLINDAKKVSKEMIPRGYSFSI